MIQRAWGRRMAGIEWSTQKVNNLSELLLFYVYLDGVSELNDGMTDWVGYRWNAPYFSREENCKDAQACSSLNNNICP